MCGGAFHFQNMSDVFDKTPLLLLQKLCDEHSLTPTYEVIKTLGPAHNPIFQIRVTVGETAGIYEDESAWVYCSVLLRLWFFKCVV
jgi:dsRNA-specific ribonuclease